MTSALLLPSPFLPGLVHAPLADALRRRGWGVAVASPPVAPADAAAVLAAFSAAAAAARPDVVVAHSNAGRFAGWVVPEGARVVYVDAALPPASGDAPMAPEGLLEHLAGLASDDGVLPPWTRWWPEEALAPLLPDPAVLATVRGAESGVPLSYVRSRLPAPPRWAERASAYLAFGDTYAEEVARARSLSWPVEVLDGALHLHHLVDPEAVADVVLALAARAEAGRAAQ